MASIFRKDIDPRCAYCMNGTALGDGKVACSRRGIMAETDHCRRFRYDPLNRVPPRPIGLDPDAHSADDFAI